MARSRHATRRALREEARWDVRDTVSRKVRLRTLREELAEKRRIKRQVLEERRAGGVLPSAPVDIQAIPIRVEDGGSYVHYPAGSEDLREVLRRLPPGVANGIEAIELSLGSERQAAYDREQGLDLDVDPFVGRKGMAALPGVHGGYVLGTYFSSRDQIQLYAYVYDPAVRDRELKETYLKLRFLSTFVHEVAHHQDRMLRMGRGRWRFDDHEKNEIYAESIQHEWVEQAVLPYLRERYGPRLAELERWIEGHVRVRIPFEWLCDEPRTTEKGVAVRFVVTTAQCFEDLIEDVESGESPKTVRLHFAKNLHYGDHLALALEIVETLIREHPGDLECLTAKADFLNHLGRNEEAMDLLRRVLSANPDLEEAWRVRSLVSQDRKDWVGVLEATANGLRLAEGRKGYLVIQQARALMELGRFEELNGLIAQLKAMRSRFMKAVGFGLQAMALLRSGRLDEALAVAADGLLVAEGTPRMHELLAVRFDALCRLGRRSEASPLNETTFEALQRRGYEDWVRHLRAQAR